MVAFAANSVLCRMALGEAVIDAASFTTLRLCSGAAMLAVILLWRQSRQGKKINVSLDAPSSLMLFCYAAFFSFAYTELSTASGALILFGAVQFTMVTAGVLQGERPGPLVWLGMGFALSGLTYLLLPGATAPSLHGGILMSLVGLAWGIYSLRGKGSTDPVHSTAWNFIATIPLTLICSLVFLADIHLSTIGIILGITSGALASALGYIIWYTALPRLTPSQAATVQSSAPILAGIGGVILLGEVFTSRLAVAGLAVLGGIGLTIYAKKKPARMNKEVVRP